MGDEELHVYGITDEPPETFQTRGVYGATGGYTVSHRTNAAFVSDVGTLEPEEPEEAHEHIHEKAEVIR